LEHCYDCFHFIEVASFAVFCFRDEYGKLYDFVTMKKLRVKNIGGKMVCGCLLLSMVVTIVLLSAICGEVCFVFVTMITPELLH